MRKHHFLPVFLLQIFLAFSYNSAAQFSGIKTVYKLFDTIMNRGDHPPLEAIRKVITNKKGDVFLIGRHGWPNDHVFKIGEITVRKIDRLGNPVWKSNKGTIWYSSDNLRTDVLEAKATADGGIIVLTVNETAVFGNDFPNGDITWSAGDIYLCKFSSNGSLEWERDIGGTRWDEALSLDIDRNDNILIAGRTWSVGNYFEGKRRSVDTSSLAYKTHGGYADTIGGGYDSLFKQYKTMNDAFVAKFSPSGQLINIKCYGGSLSDKLIHIHDHPLFGYVAVGYSDSKGMDLPAEGTNNGMWMLHLDTALNIVLNKIIDSSLLANSYFFIKDKKMYLSDSNHLRELSHDGTIIRDQPVNGVTFNAQSYFDLSGYVYRPAVNKRVEVYDSLLRFKNLIAFGGWPHNYFSIDGENRNNLHLIGYTTYEYIIPIDPSHSVHSNLVINFADQFNYLKGKVYVDNNKNNLFDNGEPLIKGVKVEAQKQNSVFTVTTNIGGTFSLPLDTGNYTVKITSPLPYYNIIPATASFQFAKFGNSDSVNFALQPIANKKDISINLLPLNIARPGFAVKYQLFCTNNGTETIDNVQLKFIKNPRVNFVASSPVVSGTIGDTLVWNIVSLKPFDTSFVHIDLRIAAPPAVNFNDTLVFKSIVYPLTGDETVLDNEIKLVQPVQGSYDPNDKTETHGGIITPAQLAGNEFLTYLIRFQNTGTDTAFNVMIRDTLQNKLDWNSFEMINASHPYYLYMIRPDVLEWSFPNILLVDSNKNEPASHGFIAYRIKPKSNLSVGDTVLNRAHIYFDYNLPVITNDELTVLRNTVITSVVDLNRPNNELFLYPNPSNGLITVSMKARMSGNARLQISDMNGRLVRQKDLGRIAVEQFSQSIDISDLSTGLYVVKLQVGNVSYTTKFILQ